MHKALHKQLLGWRQIVSSYQEIPFVSKKKFQTHHSLINKIRTVVLNWVEKTNYHAKHFASCGDKLLWRM